MSGIQFTGTAARNSRNGGSLGDTLDGRGGDDRLNGLGGDDLVVGGGGNDYLTGGVGADTLDGDAEILGGSLTSSGNGDDILLGGSGNDLIRGGAGDDLIEGNAGNDTINGGAGFDEVAYDVNNAAPPALVISDLGSAWQVVSGPAADGTDVVTNVESVVDGLGNRTLLVGHGGFATIQDAIAAATDGDTIMVAGGSFAGATIDKSVTILGAKYGVAGFTELTTGGAPRDAAGETVMSSGFTVAEGVTVKIAGFRFENTTAINTNLGSLVQNVEFANNVVIGGSNQFIGNGNGLGTVSVTGNFISSASGNGLQINGAATGNVTVSGNLFDGTGTGGAAVNANGIATFAFSDNVVLNTSSHGIQVAGAMGDVTIDGNTFAGTVQGGATDRGAISVQNPQGFTSLAITDNTVTDSPFGVVYRGATDADTTTLAPTLTGNDFAGATVSAIGYAGTAAANALTGGAEEALFRGFDGNDTLKGGGGGDTLDGGNGSDVASYDATLSGSDVVAGGSGWTVTAGTEGTDTLANIEIVDGAGAGRILLVGNGGFASIQAAIDAAASGDTIMVAAGTWGAFSVAAGLNGITILGVNHEDAGASHAAGGTIVNAYGSSVAADGVTIKGIRFDVSGNQSAESFALAVSGSGATVENNVFFRTGASGSTTWHHAVTVSGADATVSNNLFDQAAPGPFTGSQSLGWRTGVNATGTAGQTIEISGNTFQGGGVSAVTLGSAGSGAVIAGNTITGYGTFATVSDPNGTDLEPLFENNDYSGPTGNNGTFLNGNAGNGAAGIDLDAGVLAANGNTSFVNGGDGFILFNGGANIAADTLTGGEGNDGLGGSGGDDLLRGAGGNDVLTGGTGNDSLAGDAGSDSLLGGNGNDQLAGGNGDDQLDGGNGTDVAVFDAAASALDVVATGTGWEVTDSGGTDTLTNVEMLRGSDGGRVLLVGNGGFASLQAALDAAQDDDIIHLAPGTYAETVSITKAVTILGAKDGVAGNALGRGTGESVITGFVTVVGGVDVVLGGLEFRYTGAQNSLTGSTNGGGLVQVIGAGNVTIADSRFMTDASQGNVAGGGRALMVPTNFSGALVIEDNYFGGFATNGFSGAAWNSGIWSDGTAAPLTITNNVFDTVRTAANLDGYDDTSVVTGNRIVNSGTGFSLGGNGDTSPEGIDDNVFSNVGTEFNLRNFTADVTFDVGTDTADAGSSTAAGADLLRVEVGSGNDSVSGNGGNDWLVGGAGNDSLGGAGGNDVLDGGNGNDALAGGTGDDQIAGGNGVDTAVFGDGGVAVNLDTGRATGAEGADTLSGIEAVTSGAGDDALTGDGGANTLDGGAGGDTLQGGDGNDVLVGGAGSDSLDGGAGEEDRARFEEGTVLLRNFDGSFNAVAGNDTDTLSGIEVVEIGNDTILLADVIFAGETIPGEIPVPGVTVELVEDTGSDQLPPAAPVTSNPSVQGTGRPNTAITVTWTEDAEEPVELTTTVTVGSDGTWSASPPTALPQGTFTVSVTQTDGVGGTRTADLVLVHDVDAPGTPVIVGLDAASDLGLSDADDITNAQDLVISGEAEDGTVVELFIGGVSTGVTVTATGGTWTATLEGVAEGSISITAVATDLAGNASAVSDALVVTVDRTAPAAPEVQLAAASDSGALDSDAVTNAASLVIGGTAGANDIITLSRDGTEIGSATADGTGIWSFTDDGVLADGVFEYTAIAGDVAGNVSGTGAALTVTVDRTAPAPAVLATVTVDNATGSAVTVTGTKDAGSSFTLLGQVVALAGTAFTVSATSVASGTLVVSAEDLAGNVAEPSNAFTLVVGGAGAMVGGGDGNQLLTGNVGLDTLLGEAGDDTLRGGDGADSLLGGDGADSLVGGDGDDVLQGGAGLDTIDGGAGLDLVSYADAASGIVLYLDGVIDDEGAPAEDMLLLSGIEGAIGSAFQDVIFGDARANVIDGGDGDDVLSAGEGDDTVIGGAGADELDGGDGFDVASYATAQGGVVATLGAGGAGSSSGAAGADILASFEGLFGSAFDDVLTGNAAVNLLMGGAGNDTIQGGAGADTLRGGDGTDILSYSTSTTTVSVDLATSAATGGHAAGDIISGFEGVIGGTASDILLGDAGDNLLSGLNGNDTLRGAGGADTLDGGNGNDTLRGGAGDDSLTGGSGRDMADYSDATSGVSVTLGTPGGALGSSSGGGLGNDTLAADIENLRGSAFDDTLTGSFFVGNVIEGGNGNDLIQGVGTSDTLTGGNGADVFIFGAFAGTNLGTITDFSAAQGDRIDLRPVDAIAGGADNAFTFVTGAFTAAGQVRVLQSGANTIVELNTSGVDTAETTITLLNVSAATVTSSIFDL